MRIALALGMNRETPLDSLSKSDCERRRRLWWTLYIIDRKLSINMGAPLSIADEVIDISLPSQKEHGVSNSALLIHIKLAIVEGQVMSGKMSFAAHYRKDSANKSEAVYGINSTLDKSYVTGVRKVILSMAKVAEDFTGDFEHCLNTVRISRVAATLQIMYYQVLSPMKLHDDGQSD